MSRTGDGSNELARPFKFSAVIVTTAVNFKDFCMAIAHQ